MRYNCFNKDHEFIGIVTAEDETDALRIAKNSIPCVEYVEERFEDVPHSGAQ